MVNLSSPAAVGAILRRHNLRPQRRLGQNFLVDGNILAKICDAAEITPGCGVLEIGPGLGVLTTALAERVGVDGRVLSIEIDRALLDALEENVGDAPQVTVINADALSVDFDLAVNENFVPTPLHVVANIPYQITSPLIARFLEMQHEIQSIVLLVQREVAARLAAKAGASEYGAFTVFVQYFCAVEVIGTVSPHCFFPPPEVTSAIIRLRPYRIPPIKVHDTALLFKIVHAGFGQRRKTLLNALSNDPVLNWSKDKTLKALGVSGIDPGRRGETLTIQEFASIANCSFAEG
jgi:16S rRNA (adenine1518-N6/adenine1519-N6)-dimethyltransferase